MKTPKHLLSLLDWSKEDIEKVLILAHTLKKNPSAHTSTLAGKSLAMIFQKTSTRTRVSFEVAMTQLGGHAIYLDWHRTNFTLGSINDEIRCLSRYVDIMMARVYKQEDIETMAQYSSVPIINGLSEAYHPCQALADIMTVQEHFDLKKVRIGYIGDGNNVCNSLMIIAGKLGIPITVATPKEYPPSQESIRACKEVLKLTHDPEEIKNVDVMYTDTWVSMGEEDIAQEKIKAFQGFILDIKRAGNAKIMHCLPAHEGYEITREAIESKNSLIFEQAENRLHAQKAVLIHCLD